MRLNIFGYTITIERNVVKRISDWKDTTMLKDGLKVAMHQGTMYLCDTEGYIIPKKLDLSLIIPLNSPITCTVETFISGIESNPKFRNSAN